MNVYDSTIYKTIENAILKAKSVRSHLLLYTFNGSGCSFVLETIAKQNKQIQYINHPDQVLNGEYALVDMSLQDTKTFYSKMASNEKGVFVIQSGSDFYSKELAEVKAHAYMKIPFGVRSRSDTEIMVKSYFPQANDSDIDSIYQLSGGIARIVKHLSVNLANGDDIQHSVNTTIDDIFNSIQGYSPQDLTTLGLINPNGTFKAELMANLFSQRINIKVNFDLSFEEEGMASLNQLTPVEAKILSQMIADGGKISKEKISEIKWGEGKYDEYSDQAINKAVRRLSQKLTKFSIKTIPKVGFVLEKDE